MKKYIPILFLVVSIASCDSPRSGADGGSSLIDTTYIMDQIATLSDDAFLGRKPFTEGETKTVSYLESELRKLGLDPGNGDSYFQEVPLVSLKATPSEQMVINGGVDPIMLSIGSDFVAYTERVEEQSSLESSELVFAGYGIVAPEYDWNDYEGLDVEGKTVIVMVNDPGFESGDPEFFKGETMTYYGRWTYKYEEAARQGAAGVLIIHETVPAGYPWFVVSGGWSGARLNLDRSGSDEYQCAIQGWITRDAAIQIFEASNVDLKDYKTKAVAPDFKPLPLGLDVSVSLTNEIKKDVSKNVAGQITGTESPEEVIIYSAHWDHLGVGQSIDGDSIFNGAIDNASGSAMLLGIAKGMMQGERPKRTVLFLFVTAEEQGLLGSAYYSSNPIYPIEKSVANLNIDAVEPYGQMKDFTVVGYGQSELEDFAKKYAEEQGRYIYPDPDAGKGFFFRSDHFNFAKVGIPALYASGTYELVDGGVDKMTELKENHNANIYHKPQDEIMGFWNMAGVQQDAEIYLKIGAELANSDQWPKWKEGSEFKAIREE